MDTTVPESPATPSSPGLIVSVLRYVETRGLLLSLEAQEAVQQIVRVLILAILGGIIIFTGWLLLAAGLTALIVEQAGWTWVQASLALAGGHILVAVLFFAVALHRLRSSRWFADTLNEIKKDRTWLAHQTKTP